MVLALEMDSPTVSEEIGMLQIVVAQIVEVLASAMVTVSVVAVEVVVVSMTSITDQLDVQITIRQTHHVLLTLMETTSGSDT